jgi:hypothetical protein
LSRRWEEGRSESKTQRFRGAEDSDVKRDAETQRQTDTEGTEAQRPDAKGLTELTERVIGAAIEVHRHLGPGLPEKAYELALEHELCLKGLECQRQVLGPVD